MKNKVVDLSIEKTDAGWTLYVPIATGNLTFKVKPDGTNLELCDFISTAYRSPSRRFGENP